MPFDSTPVHVDTIPSLSARARTNIHMALHMLTNGKQKISDPSRWLKGVTQANGNFCTVGAVVYDDMAAFPRNVRPKSTEDMGMDIALRELSEAIPAEHQRHSDLQYADITYISQYNDRPNTTHADVMALFDRAIAALEKQLA